MKGSTINGEKEIIKYHRRQPILTLPYQTRMKFTFFFVNSSVNTAKRKYFTVKVISIMQKNSTQNRAFLC